MIYRLGERRLKTDTNRFWVAPNATLIGSVELGDNVSVWFNAVIRADNDVIRLGDNTNIQDSAVLHVDEGTPMTLGAGVTVGHHVMLHGCTIGDNSLIGINAVVLNRAKIGRNCIIGANALVPEGMEVPDNSLVLGSPGKVVREISDRHAGMLRQGWEHYVEHSRLYARELRPDEAFHNGERD